MFPDDHLRLLVHLHHDQGQHLICFVAAPAIQDSPKLLPVHGVKGLLEINHGGLTPSLLALAWVNLREQTGHVRSGRGALLEARLINLSLKQVWRCGGNLGHDGFFEDLGHMGPHHDGSDILELRLVLPLVLR